MMAEERYNVKVDSMMEISYLGSPMRLYSVSVLVGHECTTDMVRDLSRKSVTELEHEEWDREFERQTGKPCEL